MPYSSEHKSQTRSRIVESARHLFNRYGFAEVSIDAIMSEAGLTRGGFYNHFKSKDELYVEALVDYAEQREYESSQITQCGPIIAQQIFAAYVSRTHMEYFDGQCPLMALPSDVARAGPEVRAAYQRVLEALAGVFEANAGPGVGVSPRQHGLAVAATCVGAMVLARTVDDADLADAICEAARSFTSRASGWS